MTEPIHQYRIDRVAALRAVTIATQQGDRPKTIRPISPLMRQAVVVSVDATTPPSCTIQYDTITPGPTHPGTRYPSNLPLTAGAVVYTVSLGNGDTWVLTKMAGTAPGSTLDPPRVRVYRATAGTALTAAAATPVNFDGEDWDSTGTMHSASFLSRLIAPIDGIYSVTAQFAAIQNTSSSSITIEVRKNGSIPVSDVRTPTYTLSAASTVSQVSTEVQLAATDYVELVATLAVTATPSVGTNLTYMQMRWMNP
jgi:hypothetical protein